tara:strand:+ start:188 stop:703 length:516 start_codon:yes stop_codon:yes gene_type:complete
MKKHIEKNLEQLIFASRWLLAPVYIALCVSLITITVKVIQEMVHEIPLILSMEVSEVLVFVLHVLDLALVGNLVLMIIFAGYENFVSKIESARQSEDKPSWMGKVDFSGMKLKLVASIVAISGINLLEAFLEPKSYSEDELMWMVILHVVFVISGVLLAFMDYIASKTQPH